MKKKLHSPFLGRGARVEMVSLMDVMFLVLVFFVYSVMNMTVHRGLKVELPKASGALDREARPVVTISADDSLYLDGEAMDATALVAELSRRARSGAPSPVISADRSASLGAGIELLSALRENGVENAVFSVKPPKTP